MSLRIVAVAALLLAGCGSRSVNQQAGENQVAPGQAGGSGQASAEPAAAAPAAGHGGLNIQPGEWQITMEMRSVEASEMPAGMPAPQIAPTTMRSCVTPEQVSRANASFLGGGRQAGIDCDYSRVTIASGRIQGTSTCSRPGMEVSVVMDGSFTPTSYDVDQRMHSRMHGRTMSSTNHLVGRRIGECRPGQASAPVPGQGNEQGGR